MHVLITGAGGFIGRALTRALIEAGALTDAAGDRRRIEGLTLADSGPFDAPAAARRVVGDLRRDDVLADALRDPPDAIFHLAATLTLDAETDPDTGWAVNMTLPHRLMEAQRGRATPPKFLYASSIAVFGGALPEVVTEAERRRPQTSYGAAKTIVEVLIEDYSRTGVIDGRALRLPIVLIRDGAPQPVVSDIIAGLAREPLRGERVVSPLGPETRFPVVSAARVARNLIRLHDVDAAALGGVRAAHQPGLTVNVEDIRAAVARASGPAAADLIEIAPDPAIRSVVESWPTVFATDFAGFDGAPPLEADPDFDAIIAAYREGAAP